MLFPVFLKQKNPNKFFDKFYNPPDNNYRMLPKMFDKSIKIVPKNVISPDGHMLK